MGAEIKTDHFSPQDFATFAKRLSAETKLLAERCQDGHFAPYEPKLGFELEGWLLNQEHQPAPCNGELLAKLKHPQLVHELSQFNFEINSLSHKFHSEVFSDLERELSRIWGQAKQVAGTLSAQPMMIGILPTLKPSDLDLAHMSESERYLALNQQIMAQRHGHPLRIHISGDDRLELSHPNVMLESAATSLQVHWDLEPSKIKAAYNLALLMAAPMVALTANSPYLFGKSLWQETRIPLFEQAVKLKGVSVDSQPPFNRVSLGSGWLQQTISEPFLENQEHFPPLLPILFEGEPHELKHLILHNGTVWRWNRPLVTVHQDGALSFRLEYRVAAAGPSTQDVIANALAFVGLLEGLLEEGSLIDAPLDFAEVENNFYQAAQKGLQAKVTWSGHSQIRLQDLWQQELLGKVEIGLQKLKISPQEIKGYFHNIIVPRLNSGQTGAHWQQQAASILKGDLKAMTAHYLARQQSGEPVYQWSLPC